MADTRSHEAATYQEAGPYRLMPFQFGRLSEDRVLMTNHMGEFTILPRPLFADFISKRVALGSANYLDLKSRHFLTHEFNDTTARVAASQWRTKKGFMESGPKLHIFVPTLRCNQGCGYCQASRADSHASGFDMSEANALRAIDLMLASPAPAVTMEFQGGEALLAFDVVRWMTETATARAKARNKSIQFVICTNLTLLTDDHIEFFRHHSVAVSTSLDGPAAIHDRNRPMSGAGSHETVVRNIRRCQEALGVGSVSALMTTSVHSLPHARAIIDEYVSHGLKSVFLRELNPYGFAAKSAKAIGYDLDEFLIFYRDALQYILDLNRRGVPFAEGYATTLLQKILTPFGVGFVDLQSPTGEGFGTVLYNHDGNVYASDEARMLAEMGDPTFRLGTVEDSWTDLLSSDTMKCIAAAGVAEALPGCSDCVYVPYCGADPIRHYRTQGDLIGHRPSSSFCQKQSAIFGILFDLLDGASAETQNILLGWLNPGRRFLPEATWLS
jgi:His-Xaa-Ser system radical SAM maturase HxsB